nr:aminotransferase class V-fold PLP-dependent enzyme [Sedimentibacter sp.]
MSISFETLQNELIGKEYKFETPYGTRILTYADFTASGKVLNFIERYLLELQKCYANTHTQDDMTGDVMTKLLHKSETIIKKHLNAEENCYLIPSGTGATGAIERFAKIMGIYISPATKMRIDDIIKGYIKCNKSIDDIIDESNESLQHVPVIFIGPYEHHSNILIWKEGIAELVEIGLSKDGSIDLNELKEKVSDAKYKNRFKIGSFSAASNVTGIITPVFEVAEILHENNALACFDFAACAPYLEINMNYDASSYFDAVYLAPHKFLGGPVTSGLLAINKKLYDKTIPPTVPGGGTVNYVSSDAHDYIKDVEEREMAGTPGIIQIIKAALAIELKDLVGTDNIMSKEKYYTKIVINRLKNNSNIEILGPLDENIRLPIISVKIKHNKKYIHPKYVARLLNDLFGIQTRAGCSCAAPYGHRLLDISDETSKIFRQFVDDGISSVKPGWLRFNIHYIMSEEEVEFICKAIEFTAEFGYLFLYDYVVDIKTGKWRHKDYDKKSSIVENFGIKESVKYIDESSDKFSVSHKISLADEYNKYMEEAKKYAEHLKKLNVKLKYFEEEKYNGQGWFYFVNSENNI